MPKAHEIANYPIPIVDGHSSFGARALDRFFQREDRYSIFHEALTVFLWDLGTVDAGAGHGGAGITRILWKGDHSSTPHIGLPSDVTSTYSCEAVNGLVSALALT